MKHYETVGGQVTRGETFAKLIDHIREAEELCYVLSHLQNTEDGHKDKLLATGWRGIGQLLERMRSQCTKMAVNKLQ